MSSEKDSKGKMRATDAVRPTDLAPASQKVIRTFPIKVERVGERFARITSRDGLVNSLEPFERIEKRWPKEERGRVLFFQAQVSNTVNALEIGERMNLPEDKRW